MTLPERLPTGACFSGSGSTGQPMLKSILSAPSTHKNDFFFITSCLALKAFAQPLNIPYYTAGNKKPVIPKWE
jgi:hypothetical protein